MCQSSMNSSLTAIVEVLTNGWGLVRVCIRSMQLAASIYIDEEPGHISVLQSGTGHHMQLRYTPALHQLAKAHYKNTHRILAIVCTSCVSILSPSPAYILNLSTPCLNRDKSFHFSMCVNYYTSATMFVLCQLFCKWPL